MLKVTLDARALVVWANNLSDYKLKLAVKNGLNRAARIARNVAIDTIADDIGVSKARAKRTISSLRTASPGNLSASFTASKQNIGILSTAGARLVRLGGLRAATHKLSGGRSSSLSAPKAFILKANGGRAVLVRIGKKRGDLHAIKAEHPATALGQDGAAAQTAWLKEARAATDREVSASVQAVLSGGNPMSDSGSNS